MKRREGLLIDEEGKEEMCELKIRTTRVIAKGIDLRFIAPGLHDPIRYHDTKCKVYGECSTHIPQREGHIFGLK